MGMNKRDRQGLCKQNERAHPTVPQHRTAEIEERWCRDAVPTYSRDTVRESRQREKTEREKRDRENGRGKRETHTRPINYDSDHVR